MADVSNRRPPHRHLLAVRSLALATFMILGLVMLGGGLLLGFLGFSFEGVSCGSAFAGSSDFVGDGTGCDVARAVLRVPAIALRVTSVIPFLGWAWVVGTTWPERAEP